MSDLYEAPIDTGAPVGASVPPPPDWTAAPLPWASGPLWPPSVTPASPASAAPAPRAPGVPAGRGRAIVVVATATAVVAASLWIAGRLHLHGPRPTLSGSAGAPVSPDPSAAPVAPATPSSPFGGADPTSPGSDGGSSAAPAASAAPGGASALAAKVTPGVVNINTRLGYLHGCGAGTGMVLTPSGEVLTNNHVIAGATRISATVANTGRTYSATVVGTDPSEDIAVLQLQGASGLATIPTGSSPAVARGDQVMALGNADGAGGPPAVVSGTVLAVNQTITASDPGGANAETLSGLIETDAPLQPGDSGGPLADAMGQVVGMNTAASSGRRFWSGTRVGFAIPIARALGVARQVESGTATATVHIGLPGFLGVVIDGGGSGAGQGASGDGSPPSSAGAVVGAVLSGSPAATAGLVAGDSITSIDGQAVDSAQTLSTLMRRHRPGDKATVGWTDQSGSSRTASVTLAVGPPD